MNTFAEFIEKSKSNLCKEYTEKLDKAGSKKAMLDLALDANGLNWTAEAIAKGDLPIEVIDAEFKPFLNGRYIRQSDGYTSAIYCDVAGDIIINTTCALIVSCRGVIRVDRPIVELYLVNSDVAVVSSIKNKINAYLYNSIIVGGDAIDIIEHKGLYEPQNDV